MKGDLQDMILRLKLSLPRRWFADETPLLDSLLAGPATVLSGLYSKIEWIRRQVRLHLADGTNLDALATDYLGERLIRRVREDDTAFRIRVMRELLRERGTRAAVIAAIEDLTGRKPIVFEPSRPSDTGAYAPAGTHNTARLAYGAAGGWGSLNHPFQCFVTAYRPIGGGSAPGFGWGGGGYNSGHIAYADFSVLRGRVSDIEIMAAVRDVLPAGTIAWLKVDS